MRNGVSEEDLLTCSTIGWEGHRCDERTDRERGCALDNYVVSRTRLPAIRLAEGDGQRLLGARFPPVGLSRLVSHRGRDRRTYFNGASSGPKVRWLWREC